MFDCCVSGMGSKSALPWSLATRQKTFNLFKAIKKEPLKKLNHSCADYWNLTAKNAHYNPNCTIE